MKKLLIIVFLWLFTISGVYSQQKPDLFLKARALMLKEQSDSALSLLNQILVSEPDNYEAAFQRGMLLFEEGRIEASKKDFLRVNKRFKGKASFMLAKTESRLDNPEQAIFYIRQHLNSRYKLPQKEILLDPDLVSLEHHPQWKTLWNEKTWYPYYEKELQEAEYLVSSGQYPEAMNHLNELEEKGFNKSEVHYLKAKIFSETGNTKQAVQDLNQSVRSDYNHIEALLLRARLLQEIGKVDEAVADYERVIRQEPDRFSLYLETAGILLKSTRYKDAIRLIKQYRIYYPDSHEAMHLQGKVHFAMEQYIEALTFFNKTLELERGMSQYFISRGKAYAATSMHQYALKDYSMALDLDPFNGETWYLRGKSALASGLKEEACRNFKKAHRQGYLNAVSYLTRNCNEF